MAPESIVDHRVRAALEFRWADGARHVVAYRLLRANCPCADCKSRRAASRSSVAGEPLPDEGVEVMDIHPVGAYGVQLVFSDGHDRGIFPWIFLRMLLARLLDQPCYT